MRLWIPVFAAALASCTKGNTLSVAVRTKSVAATPTAPPHSAPTPSVEPSSRPSPSPLLSPSPSPSPSPLPSPSPSPLPSPSSAPGTPVLPMPQVTSTPTPGALGLTCSPGSTRGLPGSNATKTCSPSGIVEGTSASYSLSGCSGHSFSVAETNGTAIVSGPIPASSCILKISATNEGRTATADLVIDAMDRFATVPDGAPGFTSLARTYVYDLKVAAGNVFVAGEGGVSVSANGGATWTTYSGARWGAPDRAHCSAASGANWFVGLARGGLAISRNAGATWTRATTLDGLDVGTVNACFARGNTVVVVAPGGTRVSNDLGGTWHSPAGLLSPSPRAVAMPDENTLLVGYGASASGLSRSMDGGRTFTDFGAALPGTNRVNAIAVDAGSIWVTTTDPRVYVTNDQGTTWTQKHAGKAFTTLAANGAFVLAGLGSEGPWASTDGGATWAPRITLPAGVDSGERTVQSVAIDGSTGYAGTAAGVYVSTDSGQTWPTLVSNSAVGGWVSSLSLLGDRLVASTWGGGVALSPDRGATWSRFTARNSGLLRDWISEVTQTDTGVLFAGSTNGLQRSFDGGATWGVVHTRHTNSVSAKGNTIVSGGHGSGVSISADGGATWSNFLPGEIVYLVRQSLNSSRIYASTATMGLAYTDDLGASWRFADASTVGFGSSTEVRYFAVDGSRVVASLPSGLAVSSDGGTSWVLLSSAVGASPGNLQILSVRGPLLYANETQGQGLAISTDFGATWSLKTAAQNGLTCDGGRNVVLDQTDVFVGCSGISKSIRSD